MKLRTIRSLVVVLILNGSLFAAAAEKQNSNLNLVADSRNQLIKLRPSGITPKILRMKKEDSIVFLYNDTPEALVTLEIDYGKKETHCASQSLEIRSDGIIRSTRPVAPSDFASVCFHDSGTYPYKVFGLFSDSRIVEGSIVVE